MHLSGGSGSIPICMSLQVRLTTLMSIGDTVAADANEKKASAMKNVTDVYLNRQ